MTTIQTISSGNVISSKILSHRFCSGWMIDFIRSLSKAGSCFSRIAPKPKLNTSISASSTQAAGQRQVPAGTNSSAAMQPIQINVRITNVAIMPETGRP